MVGCWGWLVLGGSFSCFICWEIDGSFGWFVIRGTDGGNESFLFVNTRFRAGSEIM